MKKQIFFTCVISVFLGLIFFSSCKKENDKDNDLTTDIVGKYTNGNTTITVNKVDNSTVAIALEDGYIAPTFASTKMNSKTSFTLNDVTQNDGVTKREFSGSGTYSSNNIIIQLLDKLTDLTTGNIIEQEVTYTASK